MLFRLLRLVNAPYRNALWVLPVTGFFFICWYLLLDLVFGDGSINFTAPSQILFAGSPATLAEEVYFRGFLLNKFQQITGFWWADLYSALLFGLIHLPEWYALGSFSSPLAVADFAGIVAFGLIFRLVMRKTGSLWFAYLVHALNNLFAVAVFGT